MYKIYGKKGCSACDSAKNILNARIEYCKENGLDESSYLYEYKELSKDYELSDFLKISQGQKSFPLIFNDDEFIGTFESFKSVVK